MGNANLGNAKFAKADEFYTLRSDIENELQHYERHFYGKVIYCPCDDPAWSQFVAYFRDNFKRLGLADLLTNHLRPDGSGDFRGKEALAKLARADVVVTNPPFSLFRQFMAQLIEPESDKFELIKSIEPARDKKFIILGNINASSYSGVFPCIKNNRMWLGVNSGGMDFETPTGITKPIPATWFTNLENGKRKSLVLKNKYNPQDYPKYENYNAINVDRIKNIPCDYADEIGVPITYLMRHVPAEFDIIGLGISNLGLEMGVLPYAPAHRKYRKEVQKRGTVDGDIYMMVNGEVIVPYSRMIIRKK